MITATVFQSEHVAEIAAGGSRSDAVGDELRGPAPGCRLYEATDGWIVLCAVTPAHRAALRATLGIDEISAAGDRRKRSAR